jgi:hypothetical protein
MIAAVTFGLAYLMLVRVLSWLALLAAPTRVPERHGLIGALVVIAAAALGDVILLATAAHLAQATATQTLVAVAFTASIARLAAGAMAMTHCVRSHRTLTSAG